MIDRAIPLLYLAAAASFILALKWLSSVPTARRGVIVGAAGMALAVAGTLMKPEIESYRWIAVAFVAGTAIGVPMAMMPMTAVPQRTALSHAFGALAAALVGTAEFYLRAPAIDRFTMGALVLEVLLGFLTFTASLMAFGKLQEILPTRPITWRSQNILNFAILGLAVASGAYLVARPDAIRLFPAVRGARARVRGDAHHPDRRRGHADGDLPPQLLRGPVGRGDGVRARQQAADHRRRARRLLRPHPVGDHVPRDEPLVHQRAVRRLRAGAGDGRGLAGAARRPQRHAGRGRRDPAGREPRDRRPRLRHGRRPGAAQGPGAVRRADEGGRRRAVRHPPGGGTDAGAHERAPRRGEHTVRPAGRDGGGELRLRAGRRGPGDRRQRRHEPRGAPRQEQSDLRDADPRRGQGAHGDGDQAEHEPGVRGDRQRAVLPWTGR